MSKMAAVAEGKLWYDIKKKNNFLDLLRSVDLEFWPTEPLPQSGKLVPNLNNTVPASKDI